MSEFLTFLQDSGIYRVGVAGEFFLFGLFLWPTRPDVRRWPLILPLLAMFLWGPQCINFSPAANLIGLVLLRLAAFTLLQLWVYRLQLRRSLILAMVYLLITMPIRAMVIALALYLQYTPLMAWAPVSWLVNDLPFRAVVYFPLQILCILLATHKIPPMRIETDNRANWILCPLLVVSYIGLRYDLKYPGFSRHTRVFILLLVLAAYLVVIFITMLAQYLFILQRERIEQDNIIRLGREQYQNALSQKQLSDNILKLHHDMNNHLSAIAVLAGNDKRVREYIRSIRGSLDQPELSLHTGDALLDSLLGARLRRAQEQKTTMKVVVDFSGCDFLDPVDVCAIFCNGVDNALEASAQVSQPENRHILVKAGLLRGAVLIRISNYYEHPLLQEGGRLLITKADQSLHGIGLSSIRYSAEKYGGSMELSRTRHIFTLRVLIPAP